MLTLEDGCIKNIVTNIPKEGKGAFLAKYINSTPAVLHSKLIDKLIQDIELQMIEYTTAIMEITISHITHDIVMSITTPGRHREKYYEKFKGVSTCIISSSIGIAENMVNTMDHQALRGHCDDDEYYNEYYNDYNDDDDDY